jgi:hypothetical protein
MTTIIDSMPGQEMDIETIFEELGENCKIMIDRKEPEWCAGHMKTVYFNPDETISLDWIQKRFGGEKYQIKLFGAKTSQHKNGYRAARTVSIYGPPMDGNGIEITQGPDGKSVRITELATAIERHNQKLGILKDPPPPPAPAAPSPLQDQNLVQTLITTQGEQNKVMMQMMSDRVRSLEEMLYRQPPGTSGGPVTSPLDQVKQTAETIGMLETIRESLGGGAGAGGEESVIPMVGDIVKALITGRQQTAEQPPRGVLGPPGRQKGRPGPRGPRREAPRRDPDETQVPPLRPVDDKYLSDIADNLAGLSPDDAAECVYLAMDNMTEDQRASAMKSFLVNMSGQTELDGPLIDDDTYSQDDAQSYADPFAVSKDSKVSIQREQPDTNAQNDSADRAGDPKGVSSPTDPKLRGGARDTGTE